MPDTRFTRRTSTTAKEVGCASCHTGAYLGGDLYEKAGAANDWPNQKDLGRFAVTKVDKDKMMFKVPSLRNVAIEALLRR